MPTLSFRHLVEQYHLEALSIPFFKIDCEGCEYSVIPSFTDEQWDKIQVRVSSTPSITTLPSTIWVGCFALVIFFVLQKPYCMGTTVRDITVPTLVFCRKHMAKCTRTTCSPLTSLQKQLLTPRIRDTATS